MADDLLGRCDAQLPARPEHVDASTTSGDVDMLVPPRRDLPASTPTPAAATSDVGVKTDPDRDARIRASTSLRRRHRRLRYLIGVRLRRVAGPGTSDRVWDSFFSDFYLRAYAGDERDAEAEAQALAAARLSGCPAGGELLDVPCGFGRHSIPLAARGLPRHRRRPLGDAAGRGPPARGGSAGRSSSRADYRELPFADDSFDAALNLFTSLGYLGDEEDTKVLAAIRRVLRPGARLVIETMHRDRLVKGCSDNDWRLIGEGRLLLDQRTFDPVGGVAQTTQTLVDDRGARESRTSNT